jgi:hypothetical protein
MLLAWPASWKGGHYCRRFAADVSGRQGRDEADHGRAQGNAGDGGEPGFDDGGAAFTLDVGDEMAEGDMAVVVAAGFLANTLPVMQTVAYQFDRAIAGYRGLIHDDLLLRCGMAIESMAHDISASPALSLGENIRFAISVVP